MLVEADVVKGKTITSWPSLRSDVKNAGGNWVDQEVAQDGQFITSRKPDDIPAFSRAVIEKVSQSSSQRAAA
jgi:protease I